MAVTLEQVEKLREKSGLSYEQAKQLLEQTAGHPARRERLLLHPPRRSRRAPGRRVLRAGERFWKIQGGAGAADARKVPGAAERPGRQRNPVQL